MSSPNQTPKNLPKPPTPPHQVTPPKPALAIRRGASIHDQSSASSGVGSPPSVSLKQQKSKALGKRTLTAWYNDDQNGSPDKQSPKRKLSLLPKGSRRFSVHDYRHGSTESLESSKSGNSSHNKPHSPDTTPTFSRMCSVTAASPPPRTNTASFELRQSIDEEESPMSPMSPGSARSRSVSPAERSDTSNKNRLSNVSTPAGAHSLSPASTAMSPASTSRSAETPETLG